MASIAITEQTPKTMPSTVKSERNRCSDRLLMPSRTVRLRRRIDGPRITRRDADDLSASIFQPELLFIAEHRFRPGRRAGGWRVWRDARYSRRESPK